MVEFNASLVAFIVMISIGVIILGQVIDQAGYYLDISKNTISNESVAFTANNTCYSFKRGPVTDITAIYDDAPHTNTYNSTEGRAGSYDECEDRGGKILTNGTTGYDNMTAGTHYVDYTFHKPTGLGGTITGLMVAVFLLALILIYLGLI